MRPAYLLGFLVSLAACGPTGDGLLLGADRSFAEAEAIFDALDGRVGDVAAAEGKTPYIERPAGAVSYVGVSSGYTHFGDGPAVDYFADLSLTVDFASTDVTGTMTHFVTDLAGFEHPDGAIDITGGIYADAGNTGIAIDAYGELSTAAHSAYIEFSADGEIYGTAAGAMSGNQSTEIGWLTGTYAGQSTYSDGQWQAEQ